MQVLLVGRLLLTRMEDGVPMVEELSLVKIIQRYVKKGSFCCVLYCACAAVDMRDPERSIKSCASVCPCVLACMVVFH